MTHDRRREFALTTVAGDMLPFSIDAAVMLGFHARGVECRSSPGAAFAEPTLTFEAQATSRMRITVANSTSAAAAAPLENTSRPSLEGRCPCRAPH